MDGVEFVKSLEALAPNPADLSRCGYSDDEADAFLTTFKCRKREVELSITTFGDALLELLREWDLSGVEIGSLTFVPEPEDRAEYVVVGRLEADPVALRKDTKKWVLLDRDDHTRVMCDAAKSGASLLSGLLCVAGLYAQTAIELLTFDDEDAMQRVKADCVANLGGAQYEVFCTSILGV